MCHVDRVIRYTDRMSLSRFFNPTLCLLITALMSGVGNGQEIDSERPDTVIVRSGQGGDNDQAGLSESTRRLRGKITRWKGSALTLAAGARERQIDNARIVAIETAWSQLAQEARQQMSAGAFERAVVLLQQAIEQDDRSLAYDNAAINRGSTAFVSLPATAAPEAPSRYGLSVTLSGTDGKSQLSLQADVTLEQGREILAQVSGALLP